MDQTTYSFKPEINSNADKYDKRSTSKFIDKVERETNRSNYQEDALSAGYSDMPSNRANTKMKKHGPSKSYGGGGQSSNMVNNIQNQAGS